MTLSGFQGLVFDLDGTLVDSMPLHLAAWAHTAREFGFHFDADWFYELGGMPSRKIALLVAEQQQIALDPLIVTRCKTEHYVANLHKATVFPAMLELVERYHGRIPMGIGTGSPRINAEAVLRNTGLDRYFPVVVTADDVSCTNPIPIRFCWSLVGWGSSRQAVWYSRIRDRRAGRSGCGDADLHGQGWPTGRLAVLKEKRENGWIHSEEEWWI